MPKGGEPLGMDIAPAVGRCRQVPQLPVGTCCQTSISGRYWQVHISTQVHTSAGTHAHTRGRAHTGGRGKEIEMGLDCKQRR